MELFIASNATKPKGGVDLEDDQIADTLDEFLQELEDEADTKKIDANKDDVEQEKK